MFGNGIGTLTITISDRREGQDRDIWSLSGEAGNGWYQAEVPVSSTNPFRVRDFNMYLRGEQNSLLVRRTIPLGGKVGKLHVDYEKNCRRRTSNGKCSSPCIMKLPRRSGFLFGSREVPLNTQFHHQTHRFT